MTLALLAATAAAEGPAAGRYRCYEPPRYSVLAWFDLDAKGIAVNGDAAQPYRTDAAQRRILLPTQALPPWRTGWYFAPGASGGDAQRFTIVLDSGESQAPGTSRWERLPRCYLTTH